MLACLSLLAVALPVQTARPLAPVSAAELGTGLPPISAAPRLDPGGGYLDATDQFGSAVAGLGDLDGDGAEDVAVGMPLASSSGAFDDDGGVAIFVGAEPFGRPRHFIGQGSGGFGGTLASNGRFGAALVSPGDLDGDGNPELAVGAPGTNFSSRGEVWLLFLDADGRVRDEVPIASNVGGFTGVLDVGDSFGTALGALGDLDGDGIPDLAVGAPGDDDVGNAGAVWILFLNADGSVRQHTKLSALAGGVSGLAPFDLFGSAVAGLGDHDGDGVRDVLVGAPRAMSNDAGRAIVLLLNADGTVRAQSAFGSADATAFEYFGSAVTALGDLDGDGVGDAAVGAPRDGDGGPNSGAAWVVFLEPDGSVKGQQKISRLEGDLVGPVGTGDFFGTALTALADRNGDGRADLFVGAPWGEVGTCIDAGEVWLLYLGADGRVDGEVRAGGECRLVPVRGGYGQALAELGDLDGDGLREVAVGAPGGGRGAVWLLSLASDGSIVTQRPVDVASVDLGDRFGAALAHLGDLDGDGIVELAVGVPNRDDLRFFAPDLGGVWVLSVRPDGSVARRRLIARDDIMTAGRRDRIGIALAALGDLDGDGVVDLAVGAQGVDAGGLNSGAVFIVLMNADGTARTVRTIDASVLPAIAAGDRFGRSLASIGDLDGDGLDELVVGAPGHDDFAFNDRGEVWILFLAPDGSVRSYRRIGSGRGGFTGTLGVRDVFGTAVARFPDLDGDGVDELLVGAPGDDDAGRNTGAVWTLFLAADGSVKRHDKLGSGSGFPEVLDEDDRFGSSVASLGDLNGDGRPDLLVGAPNDDRMGPNCGMAWVALLGGAGVIDFSTEDDLVSPLGDGQALSTPPHFGRLFRLSASGANLGAAIFDSSPGGPNDPSQDLDLLVDKGNVLILQDSRAGTQSVPGTFDRPNDASDGGVLRFEFLAPQQLLSIDVIDIDLASDRYAYVRLFDAAGRRRTYTLPPGWTEDAVSDGPPGWRTLSLLQLLPQPGFAATATAVQQAGFDVTGTLVLEVELTGSGAIDEVRFLPEGG